MFRRKEEGLFDTDMDQNENQEQDAQDEKATSQASSVSFGTSNSAAQTSSAATTQQNAAQTAQRQAPVPPTANSFRPAAAATPAPAAADLSRNRLPEAKPAPTAASPASSFASSASHSGEKSKNVKRVLTVGNDILLKGEIATCDRLVIEGKVDATLNDVHTVEIAECGSFKGAAQIEDAEISGLFEGDLIVRGRLIIYATGKVRGKISYGEIEIERGGELTGEIKITGAAATTGTRPVVRNNAKDDRVAA